MIVVPGPRLPDPGGGAAPTVTVVVPMRGEALRIAHCLGAILDQAWPSALLEIVVVDGDPNDGSAAIAQAVLSARPDVASAVVPNPGGGRSANLNVGLRMARGCLLCRVDSRAAIPSGYVAACARRLEDPAVVVVGGSQVAAPRTSGLLPQGIARGLNNRFALGMAQYRRGGRSGPTDTVYLGAFRRTDLEAVGGWDESLEVNEDFDLNQRLGQQGLVWYEEDLSVPYTPRDSIRDIGHQYWWFGRWKVRYLRKRGERPRPRQAVGMAAAPVALTLLAVLVRRPPKQRRAVILGFITAAFVGEAAGAASPASDRVVGPASRLISMATCVTVVASWSLGGWWELLVGRRRKAMAQRARTNRAVQR